MKPFDHLVAGLADIPANVANPERWPNAVTVERPRKVYRFMFWFSVAWALIFLAFGGPSILLVLPVLTAILSAAGWSSAYAFAEGYRDGAAHAIQDATTLAEQARELPDEIERWLWASIQQAEEDQGYLYVVEFETGSIKVGQSTRPIHRIGEHQREAWAYCVVVTNAWISVPHKAYLTNEVKLMSTVSKQLGGTRVKREYFHGADFERVVEIAAELASRPTPARLRRPSRAPRKRPAPEPSSHAPVGPPAR